MILISRQISTSGSSYPKVIKGTVRVKVWFIKGTVSVKFGLLKVISILKFCF